MKKIKRLIRYLKLHWNTPTQSTGAGSRPNYLRTTDIIRAISELEKKAKRESVMIPAYADRQLFLKICDLMYSHYKILKIVDIETAMNIIRGVLASKEDGSKQE